MLIEKTTTDNNCSISLHKTDANSYTIFADKQILMSSKQNNSEKKLAELGCKHIQYNSNTKILIGGLGLGFTLKSALKNIGSNGKIIVVELLTDVVKWNKNTNYSFASKELNDPRVEIIIDDITNVITQYKSYFDAILIDIENKTTGPFLAKNNYKIYTEKNLKLYKEAIVPTGCVAIWLSENDNTLLNNMQSIGLSVESKKFSMWENADTFGYIFLGTIKTQLNKLQ